MIIRWLSITASANSGFGREKKKTQNKPWIDLILLNYFRCFVWQNFPFFVLHKQIWIWFVLFGFIVCLFVPSVDSIAVYFVRFYLPFVITALCNSFHLYFIWSRLFTFRQVNLQEKKKNENIKYYSSINSKT